MPLITLTTDFGNGSPYVAELKGAILTIAPHVNLVDLCHSIPPQDVTQGALALAQVWEAFPKGSIHVAVVDPGVGTHRKILLLRVNQHYFLGPDNGLFSLLASPPDEVMELDRPAYWRHPTSATFHGRDIMGPCAAHLALGVPSSHLGSPYPGKIVSLSVKQPTVTDSQVSGKIQYVDSFGNLITNIDHHSIAHLGNAVEVCYGNRRLSVASTYGDCPVGSTIALVGSSGWLEIAVVQGNAAAELRGALGQTVHVQQKSSEHPTTD